MKKYTREWWAAEEGQRVKSKKCQHLQGVIDHYAAGGDFMFQGSKAANHEYGWVFYNANYNDYQIISPAAPIKTHYVSLNRDKITAHVFDKEPYFVNGREGYIGVSGGPVVSGNERPAVLEVLKELGLLPDPATYLKVEVTTIGDKVTITADRSQMTYPKVRYRPWTWADRGVIPDYVRRSGDQSLWSVSGVSRTGLHIGPAGGVVPWDALFKDYKLQNDITPCGVEL